MNENFTTDELSMERTILSAERSFSAWIRTGLAALGVGVAVARAIVFKTYAHQLIANIISALLIVLAAIMFSYGLKSYHRIHTRLSQAGFLRKSLGAMVVMTVLLLIITALVLIIAIK